MHFITVNLTLMWLYLASYYQVTTLCKRHSTIKTALYREGNSTVSNHRLCLVYIYHGRCAITASKIFPYDCSGIVDDVCVYMIYYYRAIFYVLRAVAPVNPYNNRTTVTTSARSP